MANISSAHARLKAAVDRRIERGDWVGSFERLKYQREVVFEGCPIGGQRRALYVGIGSGHDALLDLLDGRVGSIVGIDPGGQDGTSAFDSIELSRMAADEFAGNLEIRRCSIEEYLRSDEQGRSFDLLYAKYVFHHIFETTATLSRSDLFPPAVDLLAALGCCCSTSGRLILFEQARYGLKPLAKALRLHANPINYSQKQPWREWDRALQAGGWKRLRIKNYVPYALRHYRPALEGALGRWVCDAYIGYYGWNMFLEGELRPKAETAIPIDGIGAGGLARSLP